MHDRHKVLLWKLMTSSHPTRDILASRIPVQVMECLLCNSDREYLDHLFLLCPFSRRLWSMIQFPVRVQNLQNLTITSWIKMALNIDRALAIPCNIIHAFQLQTVVTLDFIWQTRNEAIFKGKAADATEVAATISRRPKAYATAWKNIEAPPFSTQHQLTIKGSKISFDAVISGDHTWMAAVYTTNWAPSSKPGRPRSATQILHQGKHKPQSLLSHVQNGSILWLCF